MSEQGYPVSVAVRRADGRVEHVRVGTAYKHEDGFTLSMGELFIGGAAEAAPAQAPRRAASSSASGASSGAGGGGEVFPNYGRSKGGPIRGATMQDLEYYANGARRSLNDPSKSRWHDKERSLLASIEAEIARQGGGSGGGGGGGGGYEDRGSPAGPREDNEPPPHTDDDIPF